LLQSLWEDAGRGRGAEEDHSPSQSGHHEGEGRQEGTSSHGDGDRGRLG